MMEQACIVQLTNPAQPLVSVGIELDDEMRSRKRGLTGFWDPLIGDLTFLTRNTCFCNFPSRLACETVNEGLDI